MHSVFDWLTMLVFCALAVLYLQRSVAPEPVDRVYHYVPPAIGCATSDWLGNNGYEVAAVAVITATIFYMLRVLRPTFPRL